MAARTSGAKKNANPGTPHGSGPAPATPQPALSQQELYQLTLFKWRYALEATGFSLGEVPQLVFLKWLHTSRRLEP